MWFVSHIVLAFGTRELTSVLPNPAPVSTMYTVWPVPAVLSYTKSVPISSLRGSETNATSFSTLCALTVCPSRFTRRDSSV